MSRSAFNFLLDTILLILYSALLCSSSVLRFVFPPAAEADGWTLWSLTYEQWNDVRFGFLAAMTFGILLHLILHWNWVCGFVATRLSKRSAARIVLDDGTKTLYGVSMLIVVVTAFGALIGLAVIMVQAPPA